MTQESCSPGTSTPCQKLAVAKRTAFGVLRNFSRSAARGAVPCSSSGKPTRSANSRVQIFHLVVAGEKTEGAAFGDFEHLRVFLLRRFRRTRDRARLAFFREYREAPGFDSRIRWAERVRARRERRGAVSGNQICPPTARVAEVRTTVANFSKRCSRRIPLTSMGVAARKTPRLRRSIQ